MSLFLYIFTIQLSFEVKISWHHLDLGQQCWHILLSVDLGALDKKKKTYFSRDQVYNMKIIIFGLNFHFLSQLLLVSFPLTPFHVRTLTNEKVHARETDARRVF